MVNGFYLFTIYHSLFILFNYPQKVRDFLDDSAHRARVGALKYLVELREPDAAHDLFLRLRETDGAAVILYANFPAARLLALFSHFRNLGMSSKFQVQSSKLRAIKL